MATYVLVHGAYRAITRCIYVHGTVLPRESPFKPFFDRAQAQGWETHALPCGHDASAVATSGDYRVTTTGVPKPTRP